MAKEIYVGIDLGTTNTLVCTTVKDKVKCLKFKNGNGVALPSVLYYNNGKLIIGEAADQLGYSEPENVIRSSKTYMGTDKIYSIGGKFFNPVSVATEILRSAKETIYKYARKDGFDESDTINAVITVPAYFQSDQYEATKRAATDAGINVIKIITEPTAAAISYISESGDALKNKKLLVVDIGGGTFDLSFLEYSADENEYKTIDVGGDNHLGGDDFDKLMLNALIDAVYADTKVDLTTQENSGLDPDTYSAAICTLTREAKSIKETLSNSDEASTYCPDLFFYKDGKNYNFEIQWTRDEFDTICEELYTRIFDKLDAFLTANGITPEDVWRVALAGGSCSIPYIGNRIQELFPDKVYSDQDLSTLVVKGAFTVADATNGIDKAPPRIRDILSHSLGIKAGGLFSEILPRGNEYPVSFTKTFKTMKDNQTNVVIEIYETRDIGSEDRRDLNNCKLLGVFTLKDLPKKKAGEVMVDVTFEYDESRILRAFAIDKMTGVSNEIVIEFDKLALRNMENIHTVEPMNIFLAIDCSGSMNKEKMTSAREAAHNLVNNVIDLSVHHVGIISFGIKDGVRIECSLCQDRNQLNRAIDWLYGNGITPMADAILLADKHFPVNDNNFLILLSDGAPYIGTRQSSYIAEVFGAANTLKSHGATICCVGVQISNDEAAQKVLNTIASRREDHTPYYRETDNVSELSEIFEQIFGEISEL